MLVGNQADICENFKVFRQLQVPPKLPSSVVRVWCRQNKPLGSMQQKIISEASRMAAGRGFDVSRGGTVMMRSASTAPAFGSRRTFCRGTEYTNGRGHAPCVVSSPLLTYFVRNAKYRGQSQQNTSQIKGRCWHKTTEESCAKFAQIYLGSVDC